MFSDCFRVFFRSLIVSECFRFVRKLDLLLVRFLTFEAKIYAQESTDSLKCGVGHLFNVGSL